MFKKLLIVFGILIALFVVLVVVGLLMIDGIARRGIESGATYALGVNTTLDSADVGVFSGEFTMGGLNVENPEGYDSDHFFRLGAGHVALSLASLTEDTIMLPLLELGTLRMNLEGRSGKSNVDVILKNLKKFESDESAPDEDGTRFIIEKVVVTDINVKVNMTAELGDLTRLELPIDRIELEDVGSNGNKGVLISDLAGVLVKSILTAVLNKAGELPGYLVDGLTAGLNELGSVGDLGVAFAGEQLQEISNQLGAEVNKALEDVTKGLGKGTGDIGKEIEKGVEDIGKSLEKGLGGIMGGRKKSDDDKKTGGGDGD